jgi:hypothetical protein
MGEIMRMPDHNIINVHSRLPLDVGDDNNLYQNRENKGSSQQRWDLIATETSDIVRIMNRQERKFIGLGNDNEVCLLNDDMGDTSQEWLLTRERLDQYSLENKRLIEAPNESSCLEIPQESTQPGTKVGLYKNIHKDHQRWQLSPAPDSQRLMSSLQEITWHTLGPQDRENSTYSPPILYGIRGAYLTTGAQVDQWPGEWYWAAGFEFKPYLNETNFWHGYYRIITHQANKILTANAGRITQEDESQPGIAHDAQLWRLEYAGGDNYLVVNKSTDQAIEATVFGEPSASSPILGDYNYKLNPINQPLSQQIKIGRSQYQRWP